MLNCGKAWQEMAHSACAAINFQMCILHSMARHHRACVINPKRVLLNLNNFMYFVQKFIHTLFTSGCLKV